MASQRRREVVWSNLSSRRSPPPDDPDTSVLSTPGVALTSESSTGLSSMEASFSEECFDTDMFIKYDDKYICPICMMVLRDPVQTACGHRFGNKCLEHWMRDKRQVLCPVCQTVIQKSETFPDNFAKREIMSLVVRCQHHNAGCDRVMELRQQEHHEAECQYALVKCPNGCSDRVRRIDLDNHIKDTCTWREEGCPYCCHLFKSCELQNHKITCPEKTVDCENCHRKLKKKEMEGHLKMECQEALVNCFYRPFGCDKKFRRSETDEHMRSEVAHHLLLFSRHFTAVMPSGSMKYYDVPDSTPVVPVMASSSSVPNYRSSTDPGFCSDYSGTSTVYSIATAKFAVAHSMEAQSSDVGWTSSGNFGQTHLQLLTPDLSESNRRPGTYPLPGEKLLPLSRPDMTISQMQAVIENQKYQILSQAQQIRRLQEIIRHHDRELNEIEGRLCNGVYIWRLRDYNRKRQEAIAGKTTVHHSPGFYTSLHGYKMCIRANLNGVESGAGTHLSLFVHLLQGDYDELLSWPFQGVIELSVLDQSTAQNHITEKLVAKPGLAAFLKPTSKRNNKGFGYIEFAPLNCLHDGEYVKNDTMLIKVKVES